MTATPSKNIGIVANTTWNIYNFRLNVIHKLLESGYNVYVLAPVDEYIEYKEKFPTVRHIALRTLTRDAKHPFRDLIFIEELRRKTNYLKLDLLLCYTHKPNIYGALAARLNNIPSIAVVTGLGYPFLSQGWIKFIVKSLYRITSRFHSSFIFENEDDKTLFVDAGIISESKGVSIKGCGVDIDHFSPDGSFPKNGLTHFTFIGRLLYDKGIKEFVQAAAAIKNKGGKAKFVIVGEIDKDNPSSINPDELAQWMDEDIVDYKGYVKDVRGIISSSDCIVLPSYREAIARSLTESMAMGKPVIATETAGCREAIDDGQNGFLVPVKDAVSLEEAMTKIMIMDEDSLKSMGLLGRKKTEKEFDQRIIADQIVKIIDSTLD